MKAGNISRGERWFRIILGAAMLTEAWSGAVGGLGGLALEIFAWAPLLTGLFGWSPVYALFGFSTRKRKPPPEMR